MSGGEGWRLEMTMLAFHFLLKTSLVKRGQNKLILAIIPHTLLSSIENTVMECDMLYQSVRQGAVCGCRLRRGRSYGIMMETLVSLFLLSFPLPILSKLLTLSYCKFCTPEDYWRSPGQHKKSCFLLIPTSNLVI